MYRIILLNTYCPAGRRHRLRDRVTGQPRLIKDLSQQASGGLRDVILHRNHDGHAAPQEIMRQPTGGKFLVGTIATATNIQIHEANSRITTDECGDLIGIEPLRMAVRIDEGY